MGAFTGGKYPFAQLTKSSRGQFQIRVYSKGLMPLDGSLKDLVATLNEQLPPGQSGALAVMCGTDAIALYLPPLIEKATIRVSYSCRGGENRKGRWDLWDPRLHDEFVGERRGNGRHVKTKKGLRGLVITQTKLYELDAMRWDVYAESELCFRIGKELTI